MDRYRQISKPIDWTVIDATLKTARDARQKSEMHTWENNWYTDGNIWHLHSLSIDESCGYVQEIRVSLRYTL